MTENNAVTHFNEDELNPHGSKKFTLIDLLMLIMIVGVILTFIIPLRQSRIHEQHVKASLPVIQTIINANEEFKAVDGDYAFDISQLNLKELNKPEDIFQYVLTDTAIVVSTTKLGIDTKSYYFDLRDKRFRVPKDSKDVIMPDWLP